MCTKPCVDLLDTSCTSKKKKRYSYLTSCTHFCTIFISTVEMLELIMLGYYECKREIIIEKRLDRFREGSTHVANKKGRDTVSSLESPQTFQQLQKPGCSKEQLILSFLVFLFSIHSLIRKFPTILNDCLLKSCPTKKA